MLRVVLFLSVWVNIVSVLFNTTAIKRLRERIEDLEQPTNERHMNE